MLIDRGNRPIIGSKKGWEGRLEERRETGKKGDRSTKGSRGINETVDINRRGKRPVG